MFDGKTFPLLYVHIWQCRTWFGNHCSFWETTFLRILFCYVTLSRTFDVINVQSENKKKPYIYQSLQCNGIWGIND